MLGFLYNVIINPIQLILGIFYFVLYRMFSSEGFAIVGLSAVVTLLVLPLYNMADAWQDEEREKQRRMKGKLDEIKAAFHGDERHMIINTYYRQQHYHPLMQLRSVIGVAIQVPFFIAAYHYLSHLTVLSGVSFLFLNDLSRPDGLLKIGSLSVNIMPILMTVINLLSAAGYGKKLTGKEISQLVIMALIFLVLLYPSPSGLVLYWTMNNIFSLVKNIFHRTAHPGRNFRYAVIIVSVLLFIFSLCLWIPEFIRLTPLRNVSFGYKRKLVASVFTFACAVGVYFLPQIFNAVKKFGIFNPQLRNDSKNNNMLFALSCIVLAILAGLVVPLSLIASSVHEFAHVVSLPSKNPLSFIPTVFAQSVGLLAFYPLMIYCLFKNRVKYPLMLIWLAVTVCSIVNVFLFPGNYGTISVTLTFDNPVTFSSISKNEIFVNLAVLAVVLSAVLLLLYFRKSKWLNSLLSICIIALAVMSVRNFAEIKKEHNKYIALNNDVQKESSKSSSSSCKEILPFFKLSKTKQNVVVIMLDRAISNYFEEALKYDPTLKERMSGFVFYPNTASFNGHTVMGAPPLFGGYEYAPVEMNRRDDVPLVDKHNESLLVMPTIFKNAGYHCAFADPVYAGYSWTPDVNVLKSRGFDSELLLGRYSKKWIHENKSIIAEELVAALDENDTTWRERMIKNNLLNFSIFREMPVVLRPIFCDDNCWMDIEQYKNIINGFEACIDSYSELAYLPQLCTYDSDVGELVMFVNDITHNSYNVYPPDFVPGKTRDFSYINNYKFPYRKADESLFSMNVCALETLCNWWEKMKAEGVYDNTKIIIAADHGYDIEVRPFTSIFPIFDDARAYAFYNPLLLVKDFNAVGEVKTSYEFMTNADVPTIAVSHLPEDLRKNPFTGKMLNGEQKNDGITVVNSHKYSISEHGTYTFSYTDNELFHVKDNIFVKENWTGVKPNVENH